MGLDRLVVVGLMVAVALSELLAGTRGPVWPTALALGAGAAWLVATRRRKVQGVAPPVPPRPAVLIPVHNNGATVGDVAARARRHGLPVYVVDDGSTDGSGKAAAAAGATVLRLPNNRGKGAALAEGMLALARDGYSHAICLDADGQHDPDDVPAFLEAVRREPIAVWAGIRDLSGAPESSRFGRRFSNFWIWVETGWRVDDSQCGFRAYPLAPVLELGLRASRYEWEVEVLTRLLWAGVPVRGLPCRVYYPPPEERVSSFRMFWDNARISWMNTKLVTERVVWPPRWFSRVSQDKATWTGASRGTALGWRLGLGVLRLLGRRPAYAFVGLLATWYVLFAPAARRAVVGALQRSAPELPPIRGAWRTFYHFGQAIVDRFLFLAQGASAFRYTYEGVEHLTAAFASGSGAVLLSAHVGNVEVASGPSGSASRHKQINVVRFDAEGDQSRALFAAMPEAWRPAVIQVNQEEGFSALSVVRVLREGGVVVMLGDRMVDDRVVEVELLGSPCRLPAGPWLLAAIARAPVTVLGCFKEGPHDYRVIALPPIHCSWDRRRSRDAQVQEWAQRYADALTDLIRRYPTQYYNFYDLWSAAPPRGPE